MTAPKQSQDGPAGPSWLCLEAASHLAGSFLMTACKQSQDGTALRYYEAENIVAAERGGWTDNIPIFFFEWLANVRATG